MNYRYLPSALHKLADDAASYCATEWGIGRRRLQVEEPISSSMSFSCTFTAQLPDYHWLCVEISEQPYPPSLDAFVMECVSEHLPVRTYVAIRSGLTIPEFARDLARARKRGVGLVELSGTSGSIVQSALSLSLVGVREPDKSEFPFKYREPLSRAYKVFRDGDPAKGCSIVYDELEAFTRRAAARGIKHGCWRKLDKSQSQPLIDPQTDGWAKLARALDDHFDGKKCSCPDLNDTLWGRVVGITPHRNDSGHKPNSMAKLRRRDMELRTRFESATDLLQDIVRASKGLHI